MDEAAIKEKLETFIEDLYVDLGQEVAPATIGPLGRINLKHLAHVWLEERRGQIAQLICGEKSVKEWIRRPDNLEGRLRLACAISDLILSICGGVSVATVSAIIVTEGVERLCKERWENQ